MKLDKLATALRAIKASFGLDMTDLLIIDGVTRAQKVIGKVTIMEFVEACDAASQATVHNRIKKLCDQGFLRKVEDKDSQRTKLLATGVNYHKLLDRVNLI